MEDIGDAFNSGSSPHARGTRLHCEGGRGLCGIIPACAGNTRKVSSSRARLRDHPRMRGEHISSDDKRISRMGSSPHARGTLYYRRHGGDDRGIIPACAGNTSKRRSRPSLPWDHPRMRGEHILESQTGRRRWGSSPHARGTPDRTMGRPRRHGIIPACAGNTPSKTTSKSSNRDHPRMRGEHSPSNPAE